MLSERRRPRISVPCEQEESREYHDFMKLKTIRTICEIYGSNALKERVIRKWFARFRIGNFSIKEAERSGHLRTVDKIIILVDANPHLKVREIQEILDMSHGNVVTHL